MKELHLHGVGPGPRFDIEFAERLNILTGDNGLGKTFLLDVIWWVLTRSWAAAQAWPRGDSQGEPLIEGVAIDNSVSPSEREMISRFDWKQQTWDRPVEYPPISTLVIYARVDDGFSVWDPARNLGGGGMSIPLTIPISIGVRRPLPYHFTAGTLWDGLEEERRVLCNGLIRDWVSWQSQPERERLPMFQALSDVLEILSPPREPMRPGKPTRVWLDDVRDIPTIELPYGSVPVTLASAGIKRILGLAYLLVWTWYEHEQASRLIRQPPVQRLVLLMDEVEAHLHPTWQRTIIPALLAAATRLSDKVKTQLVVTTHSPLVLASLEPEFDEALDRLFLFSLLGREVTLESIPWAKQGDAVGWLVSDVFGLKQARSREAEVAIEAAEAFMRGDTQDLPENLRTQEQIQRELERVLPGHDPFWPRWIVHVEAQRL